MGWARILVASCRPHASPTMAVLFFACERSGKFTGEVFNLGDHGDKPGPCIRRASRNFGSKHPPPPPRPEEKKGGGGGRFFRNPSFNCLSSCRGIERRSPERESDFFGKEAGLRSPRLSSKVLHHPHWHCDRAGLSLNGSRRPLPYV